MWKRLISSKYEFGLLALTLFVFATYILISSDLGIRVRTWSEFSDALFYITLGWMIRSAVSE